MVRPEGTFPGIITLLVAGMMIYVSLYFLYRWWVYRRPVSLVLVFICPGWFVVAALLHGDIPVHLFDALRWFALAVTAALVWAILQVEHRENVRRHRSADVIAERKRRLGQ